MDEHRIIDLYVNQNFTLRRIAEELHTNHHTVKRILLRNGIKITQKNRKRKPFSDDHKRKISESSKGRPSYWKDKKMPEELIRKNMINHMKLGITLEDIAEYKDFDKLKFLTRSISRYLKYFNSKEKYLSYIDYFYNDRQFNAIYALYLKNDKCKWYMPTLDHKISKANGGNWDLSNLQFLTWFENRAKAEMSVDEWNDFKRNTNTVSDLFVPIGGD